MQYRPTTKVMILIKRFVTDHANSCKEHYKSL